MPDLGLDVVGRRRSGGQHFGAAKNDAQWVLQVVGDGAQHLTLEGVGALQPRPLGGKAGIGLQEFARTLPHPLIEMGVGLLELLVENDIVERYREPATENLDERAVGIGELFARFKQNDQLTAAAGPDIEHRALLQELVIAAAERLSDHL